MYVVMHTSRSSCGWLVCMYLLLNPPAQRFNLYKSRVVRTAHVITVMGLTRMMTAVTMMITCAFDFKFNGAAINVNASSSEMLLLLLLRPRDIKVASVLATPAAVLTIPYHKAAHQNTQQAFKYKR
jgi:hypothetical protein